MTQIKSVPELHYLLRKPKIQQEKPPLLLLLHGVASNERQIFSIAEALPAHFLIISVRGPLTLSPDSYAWFQVQFSPGGNIINTHQEEFSRKELLKFIDVLKGVEQFDEERICLLGFSQGGIMSYSLALTAPEKIKGIAVMSGRLLPEIKPQAVSAEQLKYLACT